jgi:hypothetical protein
MIVGCLRSHICATGFAEQGKRALSREHVLPHSHEQDRENGIEFFDNILYRCRKIGR